jgi:hypothetical protein
MIIELHTAQERILPQTLKLKGDSRASGWWIWDMLKLKFRFQFAKHHVNPSSVSCSESQSGADRSRPTQFLELQSSF